MKKLLLAAAALTVGSILGGWPPAGAGQVQPPGGTGKETISVPIVQPPQNPGVPGGYLPTTPGYDRIPMPVQPGAGKPGSIANAFGQQTVDFTRPSAAQEYLNLNFDLPDPNKDIAVRPDSGEFLVSVIIYKGMDAPQRAREMALELRNQPHYKMKTWVFTRGAEEAKAEQGRIREDMKEREKWLQEHGTPVTQARIPFTRYELECMVLVGGFKDRDTALAEFDRIKKLPPPDPSRVKLPTTLVLTKDPKVPLETKLVNPFTASTCMVVPNPSKTVTHAKGWSAEDLAALAAMNASEPFSLLKCPKKYTLVVKHFPLDAQLVTASNSKSMFGTGARAPAARKGDDPAIMGHSIAEMLRRGANKDVYVLNTKYCTYVTWGSYDMPDDPRMKRDREFLQQLNQQMDQRFKLVSNPLVMAVPR